MYKIIENTTNTICGASLSDDNINTLTLSKIINKNEIIHRLWSYAGWDNGLLFDTALVGITSLKIFKYENNKLQYILLESIKRASHKKTNIFSWDKIILELKNKTTDWYGIYHGNTCSHFVDFINMYITKLEDKCEVVKNNVLLKEPFREEFPQGREPEIKEIDQPLDIPIIKPEKKRISINELDNLKVSGLKEYCIKLNLSTVGCRRRDDYIKLLLSYGD
jgi:hypothetical protein